MTVTADFGAAAAFMTTSARLLDRRRFEFLMGRTRHAAVLSALDAYRNDDGGYGWGLEPDLRWAGSQPAGALHAFEVLAEIAPTTSPHATSLCDWLASVSLPDGGVPFAMPIEDATGTAPFWAGADHTRSSLHLTSAVAAAAHRVARHDPAVREHAWLAAATAYCWREITAVDEVRHALEFRYVLDLLDSLPADRPGVADQLRRLGELVPPSGVIHVAGGLPDEVLRPLDFSPWPDRPVRRLFDHDVIAADVARLASEQRADGGWAVDFASHSPAGALEWRGYATVRAVAILRAHRPGQAAR